MITALGAEAVYRASNIAKTADIVSALSLEALKGNSHTKIGKRKKYKNEKGKNRNNN